MGGGRGSGGFSFLDISNNRKPVTVFTTFQDTTTQDGNPAYSDRSSPKVTMVFPKNNSENVLVSTNIGITLNDLILTESIGRDSFIVRSVGEKQALLGTYTNQNEIVSFSPYSDLDLNTSYEIIIPTGGIADISKNPVKETVISYFSTSPYQNLFNLSITQTYSESSHVPITFQVINNNNQQLEYLWDFDDGTIISTNSSQISHVYTTPSNYFVNVETRYKSRTIQTVYLRPNENSSTHSSTIIFDPIKITPITSTLIIIQ